MVGIDLHVFHAAVADADIGHDHRQQYQVGEDDGGYPDAGGDAQFPYHLDADYQQGYEAHRVTYQCCHPRHIEAPECQPGREEPVAGLTPVQGDGVDHLYPVTHPHRQNQEGNQDRIGVEPESQHLQQAQLPDNGDHGTNQRGDGGAQAAGVDIQQYEGDDQRDDRKQKNSADTLEQVAHDLGEADDVDAYVVVFVALSNQLFDASGKRQVVQRLTAGGVHVIDGDLDDGGLEVIGHHAADYAGSGHVDAQLF